MTVPDEDDAEKYDEDMDMVEEMKMYVLSLVRLGAFKRWFY